ncbi:hypothetical protein K490DRAFT_34729 [Saccharata proteae CBS 121410]|uniref:HTH TFE/IIEalpha-type domain-containing protein n=1 Tax=Saccharata proteae CBS 121410 TaxID=1314787 RepID=A0A9P4LY14_9PEZI|nr:hypothetical protein K490DRAFT_34729 [Saccharata proteae CBS 121410]
MDVAKLLVRTVVRVFFDVEQVVVVDALVNHGAISASDLTIIFDDKTQKRLQKYVAKLREHGLVSVHSRSETREGAQKPTNREYYYIDYRHAVDAIKYKVHMVSERTKSQAQPAQEKKELACPRCKSQWTALEVMDMIAPGGAGFLCRRCNGPLKSRDPNPEADLDSDDTPAKFNRQFSPLLQLLRQIDDLVIPEVTGEDAVNSAKPVPRDDNINPAHKSEVVADSRARPTAVKGMATGPDKIEVTIATDSANAAAEKEAARIKREQLQAQNQLPDWVTKSTVAGDSTTGSQSFSGGLSSVGGLSGNGTDDAEDKKTSEESLDAYYAAIAKEQALREAEEAAAASDESDDDDDEFEDVVASTSTPVATDGDGAPDAKRIKLEEGADTTSLSTYAVPTAVVSSAQPSEAAEESDEDEFEDAM